MNGVEYFESTTLLEEALPEKIRFNGKVLNSGAYAKLQKLMVTASATAALNGCQVGKLSIFADGSAAILSSGKSPKTLASLVPGSLFKKNK